VSVGVQRLPIAIGALVLIASAFFLARAASPDGASNAAGWWAALGLAISPRLVMFARRIFIDIYLSMFMALTLLFFALAERYPARRRLFLILMYVCVGLGVLTKGPVALVLPALVFGCYLLAQRELGRLREMLIPLGALIMLAIVVPWYAALYARAGWAPIVSFVLGENVARYTEGLGVNTSRGPLFYLPVVFSDAFPWSVFLFVAAAAWVDDRRRRVSDRDAGFRVRTLLWLWILVIVAVFTLSAAKQDLYIFPIVPAIAALAGVTVARGVERVSTHAPGITGLRMSALVIGALLMILGAGLLYLFQTSLAVYTLEGTALAGGIAMAGGACALVLALVKRSRDALLAIAAVMIAVNWVFVLRVLPSFEAYKPAPGFATVLQARAGPNDQIVTYNVALPSLVYYLRRHTDVFYDHEPVLPLLESDRTVYLMLPRHDYETIILPAVKARTCIVSRQPMFDVKLKNVLTRERLPELLLVTNKCQ
jgi:4-amino-4-deoxy-L-arabinose transferase-like glycosyltransferase